MVSASDDVGSSPSSLRFFGKDVILYRGESGAVAMLDAYCPHMGTHMGLNTTSYVALDGHQVQGDALTCPYHGWKFGLDGKCVHIPYSDVIPKAAKVKAWHIVERYGAIFVWHDPEEQAPDIDLPDLMQWDDAAWIRWDFDRLGTLATHPIEIVDNMADVHHLDPMHGAKVLYFRTEIEGVRYTQIQGGGHRTLAEDSGLLETVTTYHGPGVLVSEQNGIVRATQLICHTPVDDGVVQVWHGLMVQGVHDTAIESDRVQARESQKRAKIAFVQDFEIWGKKLPAVHAMVVPGDGPFGAGRLWYRQFYNARAKASAIQERANGIHTVRKFPQNLGECERKNALEQA